MYAKYFFRLSSSNTVYDQAQELDFCIIISKSWVCPKLQDRLACISIVRLGADHTKARRWIWKSNMTSVRYFSPGLLCFTS